MTSKAEGITCHGLYAIIENLQAGAQILDATGARKLALRLEYLLPKVLAAEHRWWRREGLDRILPAVARKVGPQDIELIGLCILISDQSVAPTYVRLRVSDEANEIERLECKLGEPGDGDSGLL